MSYEVLARKWRPRVFPDLVGQGHVVRPLVNALDHDRLHHAFLFTGTRGVGKTTIARILAKSLNCETGVTSKPCGTCTACVEVDEGRFVDLIEVDAASRTKVDDTRELLDNVQYAPTRGRYKVYLIDEVHMLSGHSFNALLKTLEEPPPHVKFLLATTDPKKLPVTVLSRCLQFNLKRLQMDEIAAQLQKILDAEGIAYEAGSLELLARAADGSMRDGLSLLDQAITFGGGQLVEADVRAMLGTIDQDTVDRLLNGLSKSDARGLLATVADAAAHGADYDTLLTELLLALHRIALAQADPALVDEADKDRVLAYARTMQPEDVQLYYQIGLLGRRDLGFAPEPRTAVEMTLLRMLAFRPVEADQDHSSAQTKTVASKSDRKAVSVAQTTPPEPCNEKLSADNWSKIVTQLPLTGLLRELANNLTLESNSNGVMSMVLDESHTHLLSKEREAALGQALEKYCGYSIRLKIQLGRPQNETPAQKKQREENARREAAIQAINNDPNVQALQQQFNARVNPGSIRPKV